MIVVDLKSSGFNEVMFETPSKHISLFTAVICCEKCIFELCIIFSRTLQLFWSGLAGKYSNGKYQAVNTTLQILMKTRNITKTFFFKFILKTKLFWYHRVEIQTSLYKLASLVVEAHFAKPLAKWLKKIRKKGGI